MTIDKKTFVRRVQEDPSLALSVLKVMSQRVRNLDLEVAALKRELARHRGQDPAGPPAGNRAHEDS